LEWLIILVQTLGFGSSAILAGQKFSKSFKITWRIFLQQHHDRIFQELRHIVPMLSPALASGASVGRAWIKRAPSAPSLTRWSTESVAFTQSGQSYGSRQFFEVCQLSPNQQVANFMLFQ
jgi:hypothetical protein